MTQEIRTALEWFKGLPSERQAALAMDYFKDAARLFKGESDSFGPFVSEIWGSLADPEGRSQNNPTSPGVAVEFEVIGGSCFENEV